MHVIQDSKCTFQSTVCVPGCKPAQGIPVILCNTVANNFICSKLLLVVSCTLLPIFLPSTVFEGLQKS